MSSWWAVLVSVSYTAAGLAVPLDDVLGKVRTAVQPERAVKVMRQVWETDRWFTFPKFQETAETLRDVLQSRGIQDVELLSAPADGRSQFGFWTMPLAWNVESARLEIVKPEVREASRVLADFAEVPASLGMWSGPTPQDGITAEIVEVPKLSAAQIEKAQVRGKLVLTTENPATAKWLLVKHGALGAISAFTENPDLRDDRQWLNAWGDNGWGFTKSSTPLLSFSITPRQYSELRKLIGTGAVEVKATVDARYYEGGYPYVTGRIRGTGDEEVLTLGHTAEQGAHDNATGVAAMVEALTTVNSLIESGVLPRPRRSIRILAMPEMYGSMHYIATHSERMKRTVAAICLDTPAAPQNLAGTEYTFYLNPHSAKSYTDALILHIAELWFPSVKRPFRWKEYMSGTDTFLADPMIGVPTVWPYSGTGVHSHHNSADRPETVDPRGLRDLAVVTAAYLYFIASAAEAEGPWITQITAGRGYEQILRAANAAAPKTPGNRTALREAIERVRYQAEREKQAVLSVQRLAPEYDVTRVLARLDRFATEQVARLRELAGVEPAPATDDQLVAGKGLIIRRKRFGTLPLDDTSPDDRRGYPNGAWSGVAISALYWCDGKRDLAEVIRLTRHEIGPVKFEFVGYFRFLAERGYVDLTTAPSRAGAVSPQ